MKVISIGTNHAGTSFLRTIKKLNPEIEVTTYDRNTDISFLGCGIALWVSDEFENPNGLFYSSADELRSMGINVNLQHEVIAIDRAKKTVTVKDLKTGREFEDNYDKLVYAGGTWPIVPPFKGVDLGNIFISKIFSHAQKIKEQAKNPEVKKVTIVGAGYIGIELAEAFFKAGKEVTIIDLQTRIIPNYFDEEFTGPLEAKIQKDGVKLRLGEAVKEFVADASGTKVGKIITDKGEYETDLVILSIGFVPNTKILDGFDKFRNGAVKVDEHQRSLTDQDIYVIGDSAAIKHNVTHEYAHVALATNAVKTGMVAAFHISGKEPYANIKFPGVQGTNAISVFGFNLSSTGYSENGAKNCSISDVAKCEFVVDWDRNEFMQHKAKVSFKLTYDKNTLRLLGAQVGSEGDFSHTEVMYAMSLAIQQQLTLVDVALMDFYFLPHFNKPFNFVIKTALKALGLTFSENPNE